MKDFSGCTAVITGAASGIGLALARRFTAEGMQLVLADLDEAALHAAARELGPSAVVHRTDVADPASTEELAQAAFNVSGAVHVLCNNAGVSGASGLPIWETPLHTWEWVLGVNLMGIVHGLRSFVPRMLESGQPGHIVNTASLSGLVTFPRSGPYTPSKHAAVALTEMLALELRQRGADIGVSVLCPAWVSTRILDDERNRPAALQVDAAARMPDDAKEQLSASMIATGLDPAVVAEAVVEAIRAERFYVLPNAGWVTAVSDRAARIAAGGPVMSPTPTM